jgi:hypothetical protein
LHINLEVNTDEYESTFGSTALRSQVGLGGASSLPTGLRARCGLLRSGLLLRLPAGLLASLGVFVCILVHLPAGLRARCGLLRSGLLLRRCRQSDRASGNNNDRKD